MGVIWIHRQAWLLASPDRVTDPQLNNIELANCLFYTGLAEDALPIMEMSCRIANNVVQIVFERFRGHKGPEDSSSLGKSINGV